MTDFWKGKNVYVTGGTGFIGSWLVETLVNSGSNVTVLVKENDPLGIDAIKHLEDNINIVYGDLREEGTFGNLVENDVIFHLAAVTQVIHSKKDPREAFMVNALGTLNLLEAIRKSGKDPFFVYKSTDKVYGEPETLPISENHHLIGKSPYDASKLAADRLVYSYHVTYGLRCGISRCSNVIGGRDSNSLRAVPDFIRSLSRDEKPVIRGNGKHIRDYMHVSDCVRGIMSIAENQEKSNGEAFNFGTENPKSVLEIANLLIEIMDKDISPVIRGDVTEGEIDNQYLSYEKAKNVLGWNPNVSLEDGLKDTIKWYKENPQWEETMERADKFYSN